MLILAALLHLLPLQDAGPGVHCYNSPLRLGLDHPLNDPGPILDAAVFIDRQDSEPVAYLYYTVRGAYIQFAASATPSERNLDALSHGSHINTSLQAGAVIALTDDQVIETQRQLFMRGTILVGCLSRPIGFSE